MVLGQSPGPVLLLLLLQCNEPYNTMDCYQYATMDKGQKLKAVCYQYVALITMSHAKTHGALLAALGHLQHTPAHIN